ncbi:hypothetical protein EVAR_78508_1 [Eumeta japonica]|uniref:Uncharacterized protein n=1 Tax=Eumeta variegata TaxID=151549 RepID=A0A4C1TYN5_EUMVA|nr:hypothetical protein EVAR_78508_1 [Eumeta japonica]
MVSSIRSDVGRPTRAELAWIRCKHLHLKREVSAWVRLDSAVVEPDTATTIMSRVLFATSELVALVGVSCTLFLFLHTRDLSTKLRRMEGRLNDDLTAYHLTHIREKNKKIRWIQKIQTTTPTKGKTCSGGKNMLFRFEIAAFEADTREMRGDDDSRLFN